MKSQILIVLIAAATAAAANGAGINLVSQGTFNVPLLTGTGGSYGPVSGSTWTFTGASGIAAPGANSPWAPFSQDGGAGSQVAFLQQQDEFPGSPSGGDFSQMVGGLTAGTSYTLTFYYSDRLWSDGVNAYFAPDPFSVSLNGSQLGTTFFPAQGISAASFAYTMGSLTFTATSASETLEFATAGTVVGSFAACQASFTSANCSDMDTVISDVSVISNAPPGPTPEPSTFALLIPALGGLALAVRRRYKTQQL